MTDFLPGTPRNISARDSTAASFSSVLKMLNSVSSGVKASETSCVTTSSPDALVVPASPTLPPAARLDDSSPTRTPFTALVRASRLLVKFWTTRRLEV